MAIAYAYFFSPIETFVCNCSSFQKKTGEQKDQVGVQSFLQRQDITYKDKVACWEFCVDELKNSKFKVLCYLNYF